MLKAYKYRIYPGKQQAEQINRSIGVCRLVYNLALQAKIWAYQSGIKLSSFDLCYQLVDLKNEYEWIREVDSQALQAAVKKVDVAFRNFYRGSGYPKFKSKRNGGTFQCPNNTRKINWERGTLTIPKMKDIPIVLSRKFDGKIKTVSIRKTPTEKYFASILVETDETVKPRGSIKPATTIGIDVGIKSFVVSSDGRSFEPNRKLKHNLQRLKILQYRASRKKKGSRNRKKAIFRLIKLHEKISNKRLDYIHKITHELTHDNQVESIVTEDLNVSGLLKNHKLAQAISDVSLRKFFEVLQYKCDWYGKNLIKIGRFEPSSKTCSHCGHIKGNLTLSDRQWQCECCHSIHDRDLNAAINIKEMGLKNVHGRICRQGLWSRGE